MPRNETYSVYFSFVFVFILNYWRTISLLCPGSIPERDGDKLYNTCTVFSPTGTMLGKYRKVSVDVVCVFIANEYTDH